MAHNELVAIIAITSVPLVAIGLPIARAYARRMEAGARHPLATSDAAARLERIEQAVDAIAIEMERVSEGQRFTTKLLSERSTARDELSRPATPG